MITPTPGRIVWFYPDVNDGRTLGPTGPVPLAAIVAKVIHERCVNLTVSKQDGTPCGAQNVVLLQDGFTLADPDRQYCEWMPFQKGQAAKTEQLQAAAAPASAATPDLQPIHAAIADLTAKTETALAAPAAAIASAVEPVQAKIDQVEQGTQVKFEQLGDWLKNMFTGFEQKLADLKNPAPLNGATAMIGASDPPAAAANPEEMAAAAAAAPGYSAPGNPNSV